MNICMCGSQSGYPHDDLCPYPYYGGDVKQESAWMDAWRGKKAIVKPQIARVCTRCGQAYKGSLRSRYCSPSCRQAAYRERRARVTA
jgi:hypothetical protein